MSVVLYALGVILLLWGGYVLVTGDMIATLDIAATLVGYGAFVIGLGAITGAITRLARTLADRAPPAEALQPSNEPYLTPSQPEPRRAPPPIAASEPAFEPVPESYVAPEPYAPEPDRGPVVEAQPAPPRARPRVDIEPALRPEPEPPVEAPAPVLSKAERRRARALAGPPAPRDGGPEIESPVVVAPILGGGFARRDAAPAPTVAPPPIVATEPAPEPVVEEPASEPVVGAVIAPIPEPEPETPTPAAESVPEAAAPQPEPVAAVEPKVPEWLARARARREARAKADDSAEAPTPPAAAPVEDAPAVAPPPVDEAPAEEAPSDPPAAEEESQESPRTVLREGEHNGVLYRFFEDGSVEAQSEHGMRRFASLEELRATILAVRGRIDDEEQTDVEPRHEAELMVEEQPEGLHAEDAAPEQAPSASDEAAAPEPAPSVRPERAAPPEDEFEAALAALEGKAEPDPRADGGPLNLGEIRPTR